MISIQKRKRWFLPTDGLLLISAGVVAVELSLSLTPLGLFRLLFLATLSFASLLNFCCPRWKASFKKIAFRNGSSTVLLVTTVVILVLNWVALPADAQFMNNAQSWMETNFENTAEVIPLVFNVLRALFLLYMAISVVKVINAARDDEDWVRSVA
jgi:hypothetical protein